MKPISDLLANQPVLLLFAVAALGYPLGRLKIGGVSLGVAAVLFVALAFGALDPRLKLPEVLSQVGLVLFVYTLGLASGPSFVTSLRKDGLRLGVFALGFLVLGAALVAVVTSVLKLAPGVGAGGFAGAFTNTAALAAILTHGKGLGDPVVGYSVAYPMGVLGVILTIGAYLRFVPNREQDHADAQTKEPLENATILIGESEYLGRTIEELLKDRVVKVIFGRYMRDGEQHLANGTTVIQLGDRMSVVGRKSDVAAAVAALGLEMPQKLTTDRSLFDYRRIFVSEPKVIGIPLRHLNLPETYGATITRVKRGDLDFIPDANTSLQPGDRVRVLASTDRLDEITKVLGDSYQALSEIDVVSLSLGIGIGLLLGAMPIPLPGGFSLSLGLAGGPLLVALLLGYLHRSGPIVWELPYSANLTIRQLGLVLFFAGVGTRAGQGFIRELTSPSGWLSMVGFTLATCLTAMAFLFAVHRVFRRSKAFSVGMLAGFQTQPAALAFAVDQTKSDSASAGYSSIFPFASIGKILVAQILLDLLSR